MIIWGQWPPFLPPIVILYGMPNTLWWTAECPRRKGKGREGAGALANGLTGRKGFGTIGVRPAND